jgi:hypothetical protein
MKISITALITNLVRPMFRRTTQSTHAQMRLAVSPVTQMTSKVKTAAVAAQVKR